MAVRGERELRELMQRVDPTRAATESTTLYVRVPSCRLLAVAADAEIIAMHGLPTSARAALRALRYEASGTRGSDNSDKLARRVRAALTARR